jgi:hypothetical protein
MRSIACAVVSLALLSGSAFAKAEPPEKCLAQADKVIATLQANVESNPDFELQILTGDRAKKLVATVNAFKPVTHYGGDRVIVVLNNGEPGGAMMIFVVKDCVTHPFSPIPMSAWRKTLQKAFGAAL